MNADEVVRAARESSVQLVTFMYCDNAGVIRNKSTHVDSLKWRMESGIGFSTTMQAMAAQDRIMPFEGMTVVGEFRLVPDPATFKVLPYAPQRATMIGDLMTLDRQPYEACPRSFLKRMIAEAEKAGIRLQVSFETEWTLARKDGDRMVPCDHTVAYAATGMTEPLQVVDDVIEALGQQGLSVEIYHPEGGPCQQEVTLRHSDPLATADNQLIYRETVRNIARRHGFYASLAPMPFADKQGNGCHIHISAWDMNEEKNLFHDPKDSASLSATGYHFLAGLLEHMPGLTALTCPSVNSYRRLSVGNWASAFIAYGPNNREAAGRIPSTLWGREHESVNLELKPPDASANPYIAMGGAIAAGLDGIRKAAYPPDGLRVDSDPGLMSNKVRADRGVHPLPGSLAEASDALQADNALIDAMGPVLTGSYLAVRRGESELFDEHDDDFEFAQHFHRY